MATATLTATRGGAQGGVALTSGVYQLLDAGTDLGAPQPQWTLALRRDGVGRAAAKSLPSRQVTLAVIVQAGSKDATVAACEALAAEAEACARSGGTLRWQSLSSTYPVTFRVQAAAAAVTHDFLFEARSVGRVVLTMMCDPYAYGDAMSLLDRFLTDSTADYVQDKASGTFAYSSGALVSASSATRTDWRHTARGHVYTDAQVTLEVVTGASVAGGFWDAVVRKDSAGADTYLAARISQSAGQVQVVKRVAGTASGLASAALTVSANTRYWIRVRVEGAKVTAEAFVNEPTPLSTATATATYVLTPAEQATFVEGHCGFSVTPAAVGERIQSFRVQSYVYRGAQPDVVRLRGIPGQLPAEATIDVSVPQAGSVSAWGQVFYGEGQDYPNLVWNGEARSDTAGWFAGSVGTPSPMVHGSATSLTRISSDGKHAAPFYGTAAFQVVEFTNAQSGVDFTIYRRFNAGRNYVGLGWTKQAAGTVTQRLSLGGTVNDAGTVSYTPGNAWDLRSVVWQPSADRNLGALFTGAHISGTAGTVLWDGVGIFEAPMTTWAAAVGTVSTLGTVTSAPADGWPRTPFYALADPGVATNELVRVTAVSGGTVLTMERGADQAAAAGTAQPHASGGTVALLAAYEPGQSGAHGTFVDVIPFAGAASFAAMTGGSADANARSGYKAALNAGSASGTASVYLDPSSGVPGFFSGDEMLLEVWARVNLGGGAQGPTMAAYVWNEAGLGAKRYEVENQASGYTISPPTSTAWRFLRLGVVSVRFDDFVSGIRRAILALVPAVSVSATFDIDYVIVHPFGQRVGSVTGQADDASWPDFADNAAGPGTRRMNAADLGGGVGVTFDSFYPAGGIAGDTPIVLPGPNVDAVYRVSNLIPNDTSTLVSSDLFSGTVEVRFDIVPRYLTVR